MSKIYSNTLVFDFVCRVLHLNISIGGPLCPSIGGRRHPVFVSVQGRRVGVERKLTG